MDKKQFLDELKKVLKNQKKEDLEKTVKYYDLIIDDYVKGGATEEEAVACLDTPMQIYEKLNVDIASEYSKQKETIDKKRWESILVIPVMAIVVALCFLAVAISLGVMLILFSIEVILALGGFGGVIGSAIYLFKHLPTAMVVLGVSLIALSIVMATVKPFLKICTIMTAISLSGLKRASNIIVKSKEVKHD